MDNKKGPLPLSLLLTHIHTASASGSPSFPQTAHLTTPRNEGKLFMQNHKGRFKERAYKTFKMNTHLCCFEYILKKDKHTTSTSLNLQQWVYYLSIYIHSQLYLHKAGNAYNISEWYNFSLQRTHGDNVLALLIKHNTVDACKGNIYADYLHYPIQPLWFKQYEQI